MSDRVRWIVRRGAWVLLLLLLAAVAAWTLGNVIATSRLEAAVRGLQEAGYPTSAVEMAPPSPPPGEDAAPYFTAALSLYVKPPEDPDVEWEAEPPDKIAEMTPEQRSKLKTWIVANQESFDMIARARKRPRCRFEHDFTQGYSMLLPEVSNIIALSRILRVRAVLLSLDGDSAGAQDSLRSILALGESVREEPVLVEQLIRFIVVRLAMGTIDACVNARTSEGELRAWAALLPREGFLDEALTLAVRGEIGMHAATMAAGPHSDVDQAIFGVGRTLPSWLFRPLVRSDAARFLGILRQAAAAYGKPYPEARNLLDRLELDPREARAWTRPVCSLLLPAFGKLLESWAAAQAHVAVVRAGIEAELARQKSGKYPEAAGVRDPFTGKPLRGGLTAGKISSVGPTGGRLQDGPIEWVLRETK
jgi:hypothetical protein